MEFSTYDSDKMQMIIVQSNAVVVIGGNIVVRTASTGKYGGKGDGGYEFMYWWHFEYTNALKSMTLMFRQAV